MISENLNSVVARQEDEKYFLLLGSRTKCHERNSRTRGSVCFADRAKKIGKKWKSNDATAKAPKESTPRMKISSRRRHSVDGAFARENCYKTLAKTLNFDQENSCVTEEPSTALSDDGSDFFTSLNTKEAPPALGTEKNVLLGELLGCAVTCDNTSETGESMNTKDRSTPEAGKSKSNGKKIKTFCSVSSRKSIVAVSGIFSQKDQAKVSSKLRSNRVADSTVKKEGTRQRRPSLSGVGSRIRRHSFVSFG